jgi:hypothetical protein
MPAIANLVTSCRTLAALRTFPRPLSRLKVSTVANRNPVAIDMYSE